MPGGYVGNRDTPPQAAIREVKEETSLAVSLDEIVGLYSSFEDSRGIDLDIIYQGLATGTMQLSNEHKDWKFFSPNTLPKHIAYKHREAITDWLRQK